MSVLRHAFAILVTTGLIGLCAAEPLHVPTVLMRSTFKLQGSTGTKGGVGTGTVFILGQPDADNPKTNHLVLVTAAHVLEALRSETATLLLRTAKDDGFERLPFSIRIRDGETPLWTRHPDADVAAMRVALPKNADLQLISTNLLATDDLLQRHGIGPGEEFIALGFPHGAEANSAGFPILRSGRLASYPLTPAAKTKTFLLDFQVFPGNSGGPVFLYAPNRGYDEQKRPTGLQAIVGLVSRERNLVQSANTPDGKTQRSERTPLKIGVIVHAHFIREVLDLLPPATKPNPPSVPTSK